jgi:hypothetical protein
MTDITEQDQDVAVSEQSHDDSQETTEVEQQEDGQKMVPLSAMLATRKKLQEAEARAQKAEAASQVYQEHLMRDKNDADSDKEDPNALVEKKDLAESAMYNKRDILETIYQDMNPEAVLRINKYLKPILEQKPWLAASVDSAANRWARADEIVKDYLHLVEEKPRARTSHISDGQRIVQNSQKPRSPVEVGKSAKPEGMDYLKSIQGKKEFREYREKVLRGET